MALPLRIAAWMVARDKNRKAANSALDARDHALTQAAKRVESAGRVNESPETRPNSVRCLSSINKLFVLLALRRLEHSQGRIRVAIFGGEVGGRERVPTQGQV